MKTYPEITTLTPEELKTYPVQSFQGKIIVVEQPRDIDNAVEFLSKQSVLGFDTETRPSFTKNHTNSVALLQLGNEEITYLFRINKIGLPQNLASILSNENIIKVGVAVRDDIKGLQKISAFEAKNFVDLQTIAKQLQLEAMGLRRLTPLVLGFCISKKMQLSNWENIWLTKAQKQYAATDAWVSLKIYQKLQPFTL